MTEAPHNACPPEESKTETERWQLFAAMKNEEHGRIQAYFANLGRGTWKLPLILSPDAEEK
jgi:hypothetical protein